MNGRRHECTGQLPHSWKSASDLKSTATFRPSSDPRGFPLRYPAGPQAGGLLLAKPKIKAPRERGLSTENKRTKRNELRCVACSGSGLMMSAPDIVGNNFER